MLNFHDVTAQEVMTPRMSIEALADDITVDQAIKEVLNYSHSRIPVYHESIDTIRHIVSLRELMQFQQLGQ
jgi:CBS domain containing-hemolysin-like protein